MEDLKIVELYWNRIEAAISETAKKYGNYLYIISYNILRSEEDSEECLNDTYMKAWNTIPPQRPTKLKAFLSKITRNLSLDTYRHSRRVKRGGGEVELVIDELSNIISTDNVEEYMDEQHVLSCINIFLESQSREKRNLFLMRYFYFYSISEIAKHSGRSEKNISSDLYRIKKDLKEMLQREGVSI